MKIIAHRGGKIGKENSLEALKAAACMGVDAVECDIRRTKDGTYVIYHDDNLCRLVGKNVMLSDVTIDEMSEIMENNGQKVLKFDDLINGYSEKTPILLHIKLKEYDEAFAEYIASSGLPIIAGVMSLDMLKCFSKHLPPERILAFLPKAVYAKDFYDGGAGIIRLWEQWLGDVTPSDIKKICPDAQVYIMACNLKEEAYEYMSLESMDGSYESLDKCYELGADGVLLNDIDIALDWRKNK